MTTHTTQAPVKAAPKAGPLFSFIKQDIKGGAIAKAFRLEQVRLAVIQALKNNANDLNDARGFADGKSKKALAYSAGFASLGDVLPVPYVGAFAAIENKSARDAVHLQSETLINAFASAFNAVFDAKPIKKEKAEVVAEIAVAGNETEVDADDVVSVSRVTESLGATVDTFLGLITNGMLSDDQMLLISAALVSMQPAATSFFPVAKLSKSNSVHA